jgi:type IV secretion system protein VirD4
MSHSPQTWGPAPAVPPSPRGGCSTGGCLPAVVVVVGSITLTAVGRTIVSQLVPSKSSGAIWTALQLLAAIVAAFVAYRRYTGGSRITWWAYVLCLLTFPLVALGLLSGFVISRIAPSLIERRARGLRFEHRSIPVDPLRRVRDLGWSATRGGAFLGLSLDGRWLGVSPEDALLVIGPPRQGKTTGVVIPSVLIAPGACVSTSVKDDVFCATYKPRSKVGRVWRCDPSGDEQVPEGVIRLRWSPVSAASTWDAAQLIADSMANALKQGDAEGAHFIDKSKELLAPLLYAAHVGDRSIVDVSRWVHRLHEHAVVNEIGLILEDAASTQDEGAELANDVLLAIITTDEREKSGIVSTTNRLLRAYTTLGGRRMGEDPNFSPEEFVRSTDTVYITTPADRQALYAPIIVGLLEQIRYSAYRRHARQMRGEEADRPHVSLVLDEIANTAPIPVPAIVSEAGGQGVQVIAAAQDFSQMSARWGQSAEALWTLFKVKMILSGIGHASTLESISQQLGEYDRLSVSEAAGATSSGRWPWDWAAAQRTRSTSHSYVRQRQLSPGEIANLPAGHALGIFGGQWRLVKLTNCFRDSPWVEALHATESIAPSISSRRRLPTGALEGESAYAVLGKIAHAVLGKRTLLRLANIPRKVVVSLVVISLVAALALMNALAGSGRRDEMAPGLVSGQQSGPSMGSTRSAPTPAQARALVTDYVKRLNQRNYDSTWSSLTAHFQQTVNQNDQSNYRSFWGSVSRTSLWGDISTHRGIDGRTEWLSIPLRLDYAAGKTAFVWSWWGIVSNGKSLMIDSQLKGIVCETVALGSCKPEVPAEVGSLEQS